jgi:hypothetical protein
VRFKNDKASELGIPLPAGAVRVYGPPAERSAYIGAASMSDTPKDTPVFLTLSEVFDVYSRIKTVSTKPVDKRTIRKSYQVVVHNEKAAPVKVRLVQWAYGAFNLREESAKSIKVSSGQRQWTVEVPAGGEKVLTYSIDLKV